jgi:hypothetical protein
MGYGPASEVGAEVGAEVGVEVEAEVGFVEEPAAELLGMLLRTQHCTLNLAIVPAAVSKPRQILHALDPTSPRSYTR